MGRYRAAPNSDSDIDVKLSHDEVRTGEMENSEEDRVNSSNDSDGFLSSNPDDMLGWLVFGEDSYDEQESELVDDALNFVGSHWEVGTTINELPHDKLDEKPASLN